ncbi:hypothetical protein DN752_13640 [Echinicola strongylocentroti]|uniref:Outer membrane insertion C-signal n=1 Tax=Echinicola strongylocentroti TaxID=1795355 RepID=A0A2Z4IL35_9BACT|nr:hypothetical protein [Echinicola strongylocentroti]AWW31083.1 hypothetical protein DN752_13640 [Echinicola strongylocentroti]
MNYLKFTLFLVIFSIATVKYTSAQVTVGVYSNGILTQLGAGTDPEKEFFGEGRLFAGDVLNPFFGAEAIGQYNFHRSDWYNASAGLMLGYYEFDDGARIGAPVMLAFKPISNHRAFSIMMEATPLYNGDFGLRGNFGLRYTIGKN